MLVQESDQVSVSELFQALVQVSVQELAQTSDWASVSELVWVLVQASEFFKRLTGFRHYYFPFAVA